MTALRFGPPSRQLFGLYLPPAGAAPRGEGVLLCNPFGQEAIRCHRLYRVLGERLARDGYHVLRFDYFGTGDSDGEDLDGDLPAWIDDVCRADEELAALAGVRVRSWFGLRLGGTLATLAAATRPGTAERLVLWDPVVDGAAYLESLERDHAAELKCLHGSPAGGPAPAAGAPREALGFAIGPALESKLRALSLQSFAATGASRATVLDSSDTGAPAALAARLAAQGTPAATIPIASRIRWASDEAMNTAIVPPDALGAIGTGLAQAR